LKKNKHQMTDVIVALCDTSLLKQHEYLMGDLLCALGGYLKYRLPHNKRPTVKRVLLELNGENCPASILGMKSFLYECFSSRIPIEDIHWN